MKKAFLLFLSLLSLAFSFTACTDENEELLKQIEEYRAAKRAAYAAENERYEDYEVDVAFLGDSLTDGYDLATYYPDLLVSNRGIGGDTTYDLEGRMEVSLYDLKPKVAVMLIGANNMDAMFENYEALLRGFEENVPRTKIILLSLTSMGDEWGKKNQLAAYNNVKIKLLAEKYGYAYVDLYSALFNLESGEIYPEYTTDGGHLTPLGYEVLTNAIRPAIDKQLLLWESENA
jgi:lysophospholipase L1-like esterase